MPAQVQELKLRFTSEDGVTGVANRIRRNLDQIAGPAVKPRFGGFEQDVRNQMAKEIRVMREAAQRAATVDRHSEVSRAARDILGLPTKEQAVQAVREVVVARDEEIKRGGFLEYLGNAKKTFGSRGPLKDVLDLAVGGGAVAGLTFAFNGLAGAVDGVDAQLEKLRDTGTLSVDEVRRSIVKSVPVIGNFVDSLVKAGQTYLEIQMRARDGIPMPQGPAGEGARQQALIDESQKSLAKINSDIAFEQKTFNATEHEMRLAIIDKERDERLQAIRDTRDAEIDAIMKARGLEGTLGGRTAAEAALGSRNLEFQQAEIDAAKAASDKRAREDANEIGKSNAFARSQFIAQAKGWWQGVKETIVPAGGSAKDAASSVGQIAKALFTQPDVSEAERRAQQFRVGMAQGFTGESRLQTGVGGQFENPTMRAQLDSQKRQEKTAQSINEGINNLVKALTSGALQIGIIKPS